MCTDRPGPDDPTPTTGAGYTDAWWEERPDGCVCYVREDAEYGDVWTKPLAGCPVHPPTNGLPEPESAEDLERWCRRCGGLNAPWSAPSPLWNLVMRGNDITGDDDHAGIVCLVCFVLLAQQRAGARCWRLYPEQVDAELTTVTPSGRIWDADRWLWVEGGAA